MAQKRKTTKNTSKRRASGSGKQSGSLKKEIGILVTALVCILLFLGVLDVAGSLGSAVHTVICGLFGAMGYVFPFILGASVIYLLLKFDEYGASAIMKILCVLCLFICLCALSSLLDSRTAMGSYTAAEFYENGKTGFNGGLVGGAVSSLLYPHIGIIASYIIFVFLLLIFFILITGKSFFAMFRGKGERVKERVREDRDYARQKREIKDQERHLRREEKLAERREQLGRMGKRVPDDAVEDIDMKANSVKGAGIKAATQQAAASEAEAAEQKAREEARRFAEDRKLTIRRDNEKTSIDFSSGAAAPDGDEAAAPETDIPAPVSDKKSDSPVVDVVNSWTDALSKDYYEGGEDVPDEIIASADEADTVKASQNTPADSIWGEKTDRQSSSGAVFSSGTAVRKPRPRIKKSYRLPPLSLLNRGKKAAFAGNNELKETAAKLERTLRDFGVGATVEDISCGPTVTRYELKPDQGIKISRIVALTNDIKLSLAASDIRIEAPIPGKSAVGIDVPNSENATVALRDILESDKFQNAKSKLTFGVGKDIAGDSVVTDIARMPHLLIGGATGSGKSVCLNTIIISILTRTTPDEVKFIMIDPKQVELTVYQGIPHLLVPVVTDAKKAAGALNWGVAEMDQRYTKFSALGVRDLASYNEKIVDLQEEYDRTEHEPDEERPEKLPELVIIIDEMADLMMVAPHEVEDAICRLAQLARAAGIHIVLATQRPSVKVVTGLIKTNIPSKIALAVASGIDSRIIIDMVGAENLLGKGDMLFAPQWLPKPVRIQGAFVSDDEVTAIVDFWKNQKDESYEAKQKAIAKEIAVKGVSGADPVVSEDENDELFEACGRFIIENDKASIGNLQRRFKIGFNRAARIMDSLSDAGVVGPDEGKKPREVLMTIEEFEEYINSQNEI